MNNLPLVKFGSYNISRLIVAGNPFAHTNTFSKARNRVESNYLTLARSVELLEKCVEEGINAFQGRGSQIIFDLVDEYVKRTGKTLT